MMADVDAPLTPCETCSKYSRCRKKIKDDPTLKNPSCYEGDADANG